MNSQVMADHNHLENSSDEAELSLLMRESQNGNSECYRQLLVRIQKMMASFIENSFRRLGLSALGGQEDVIQEVLLAIHTKRSNYDPSQYFLPWMYAIARYKIIDYFRKHRNHLNKSVSLNDEIQNIDVMMTCGVDARLDLANLFKVLSEKQQTVLRLMKLEGLSISEVSKKTGYSASDIKVTVHRALRLLQQNSKEISRENV